MPTAKMTRSVIAAPAPRMMPHFRWFTGNERQASAITSALSPDRMISMPMIWARPAHQAAEKNSTIFV